MPLGGPPGFRHFTISVIRRPLSCDSLRNRAAAREARRGAFGQVSTPGGRLIFPIFRDSSCPVTAMIVETFFLVEDLQVYSVFFFQDHLVDVVTVVNGAGRR